MTSKDTANSMKTIRRWGSLVGIVLVVSGVWLVVLPWIGARPHVSQRIQDEQARGIDPSAMFYSELELLPPIAHRMERMHERDAAGFWPRAGMKSEK